MRRTRPRSSKLLFAASLVLGVVATLILRSHLARVEAAAAAAGPGVATVVAARDLERGATLAAPDLEVRRVPAEYRPPGAAASESDLVGQRLGSAISTGEPVTRSRIAPPGGPVASSVPPSLRAVSLGTDLPPAAIAPGDHVEVFATYGAGQPHTEVVAESAEVLRVLPGGELGGVTLFVLVDRETAERLAFARAFADLSVAIAGSLAP